MALTNIIGGTLTLKALTSPFLGFVINPKYKSLFQNLYYCGL